MTDRIEVDEFARDPLAFVDQLAAGRSGLVITRDGTRVAALVNMREFEMIERIRTRIDELCDQLGKSFADLPEEEVQRLIDQACAEARREVAAEWRAAGRLP
jgi:hypothetical protein